MEISFESSFLASVLEFVCSLPILYPNLLPIIRTGAILAPWHKGFSFSYVAENYLENK